jgi:drug/metabolite transporter (DMT)-like permease
MKTAIVLVIAIVSQAVGDVYLTRGMKAIAAAADSSADFGGLVLGKYLHLGLSAASSVDVLVGTVCLIIFFALYTAALSWADLSFVLPATAFGYVLNVAAGYYFLNEAVSPGRWAGSVIITLGVLFVSRSGHRSAHATGGAS